MALLNNYSHFGGRHWETGTVFNYYSYRAGSSPQFNAPHTGRPYSEALLLGVSGGITLGYFTFAYKGYDPQCNVLTRNTFDPMETMLARLGVVQEVQHTQKAERAVAKLVDVLADGVPAIVWADMWSMPYNGLDYDKGMWGVLPLIVYGYDGETDRVAVADRAAVGLSVTTAELAAARGRVKKNKFRLMTLGAPDGGKLAGAVRLGIGDTIRLFTEKPPKGSRNNFGLQGLQYWAKMLRNVRNRSSWEKLFPAGIPLYAGMTTAYNFAFLFGKGLAGDGERGLYADFLDEARVILNKPALGEVADLYRECAKLWQVLGQKLLPDEVALLREARELLTRRHRVFIEQGGAALGEMRGIDERLSGIRAGMEVFPLAPAGITTWREGLADHLLVIHDAEAKAVEALSGVIY